MHTVTFASSFSSQDSLLRISISIMLEAKRRRAPVIPEKTESKKQNPKKKKKQSLRKTEKKSESTKNKTLAKQIHQFPKAKKKMLLLSYPK